MPQHGRRPVRIACIGAVGSFFHERLCHGLQRYVRQRPGWYFRVFTGDVAGVAAAATWQPDGAVAHVDRRDVAEALAGWAIPVINSSGCFAGLELPYVGVDNLAVGRLAGAHLVDAGYRRFAFVGVPDSGYSLQRLEGFRATVGTVDAQIRVWPEAVPASSGGQDPQERVFGDWLEALPDRCGLLACRDPIAVLVTDHARDRGIAVPGRLAIISGLDEEVPGEPPLTAVRISVERWGYAAAQFLGTWLDSGQRPEGDLMLAPEGVEVRASTSPVVFPDPVINQALVYIREHADRPLDVMMVANALNTSRRALERRFANLVGRSILHEIHRAHTEHAKVLLMDSDLPLKTVARRCGLGDEEHLRRVFQKSVGETPGAWRKRFREG